MDIARQSKLCKEFREMCADILSVKEKDYSPDGIAFKEMKEIAEDLGIQPIQVLWVHFKKHYTAIKAYMKHGQTESEPIEERLKDLANYCALMYVLIQEQKEKCIRSK